MKKICIYPTLLLVLTACVSNENSQPAKPSLGGGRNIGQLNAGNEAFNIDGLGFKTNTVTGTSVDGQFSYNDGEDVTFLLGHSELFTVKGDSGIHFSQALAQGYSYPDSADNLLQSVAVNRDTGLDPIHAISNKMKLLLMLDSDRDQSNGINLSDWHQKLANTTLDFDAPFNDNRLFQKTFVGSLSAPTAMDVAEPLITLYSMEGITIPVSRLTNTESSWMGLEYKNNYQYDYRGNLQREENVIHRIAIGLDIRSDVQQFTYDALGLEQSFSTLQRRDLDTDTPETYYSVKQVKTNGYQVDNGYPVITFEEEKRGTNENDLTLASRFEGVYKGILPLETTEYYINSDDSTSTHIYTYDYDDADRQTKQRQEYIGKNDIDGDVVETLTNIFTTTYSENNDDYFSVEEADLDNDGELNTIRETRSRVNNAGFIIEKEFWYRDGSNTLTFHRQINYQYNDAGIPVLETEMRDVDKDGSVFEIEYNVRADVYNEFGQLIEQSETFNPSNEGVTQTITRYTYETSGVAAGKLSSIEQTERNWTWGTPEDERPEPIRVNTYHYTYDNQSGRIDNIRWNQLYEGEENYRQVIEFSYDENGNLTDYNNRYNADNVSEPERVHYNHFTYEETENGLGYLLRNQTRERLNSMLSKTRADFDVYFNQPALIRLPRR